MTKPTILKLCIMFIILNVVDVIVSYYGIFTIGLHEYNPIVTEYNYILLSGLKLFMMVIISYITSTVLYNFNRKMSIGFMSVVTVLYVGIVVNNLYWIWWFV